MYLWNTDEGGPCVLRPTSQGAFDNPAAGSMSDDCVDYVDDSGQCVIDKRCKSVFSIKLTNSVELRTQVLYMSFDKFLLAVEPRDLSQAYKSIKRVSSFPKLRMSSRTSFFISQN